MAPRIKGLIVSAVITFSLFILPAANAQTNPQSVKGDWFVILEAYGESQFDKAQEKADAYEKSGYSAIVINTGDYSNLKDGLWAVVLGPYSKVYAGTMKNNVNSLAPGAYIKKAVFTAEPNNSGERADDKTWFVILGTFSKSHYKEAGERVNYLQENGYSTRILDTDNYPNLKNGLWAVVMGPYSQQAALDMSRDINPVVPDAFIKPGF